MKVKEMIEILQRMPENMEVYASFGNRMPNKVEWVNRKTYADNQLDFDNTDNSLDDYWERLRHQYAGMAMQGMLSNTTLITVLFDATKDHDELLKEVIICSHEYAHALVEKYKKEERK